MIWLAALSMGLCAALLVDALLALRAQRRAMERRLGRPAPRMGPADALAPSWGRPFLVLGRWLQFRLPAGVVSFVRRRLVSAGLHATVEQFLGQWALLLLLWYLMISTLALSGRVAWWLTIILLGLALLAPFSYLAMQEAERKRRIRKEFPFLIDFITMAVEAGLSLETGLLRACAKLRGPLREELQRYLANINRGLTRRDALQALAAGLALPEVDEFVQVLIQSSTSGLPLAGVLRSQADLMRESRRLQAQEVAQRIPILLLFPLVLFIFPTIFLFTLGPALIWVFEHGL